MRRQENFAEVVPGNTFVTSQLSSSLLQASPSSIAPLSNDHQLQQNNAEYIPPSTSIVININDGGSTGRGILIGLLSAFGSAGIAVLVLAVFFFFKYTSRGRIILDRIGRPGEYDDEQAFAREEAEALEHMEDLQRAEYLRAKGL